MCVVQLPDNNEKHQDAYGMVTVAPATIIYYKDEFQVRGLVTLNKTENFIFVMKRKEEKDMLSEEH